MYGGLVNRFTDIKPKLGTIVYNILALMAKQAGTVYTKNFLSNQSDGVDRK
jgi:hypothetical protein